jgi:hypothetical protein
MSFALITDYVSPTIELYERNISFTCTKILENIFAKTTLSSCITLFYQLNSIWILSYMPHLRIIDLMISGCSSEAATSVKYMALFDQFNSSF